MAFVPNYEHDIFVSYAHVDNQPDPGVERGWVTTLVELLKIRLAQKLGRSEVFSLWMDHQLSRHVQITPQIMDILRNSATLLVILSPGYVASDWCQREQETFLKAVQERVRAGSRVFIVERDKVEADERPEQFRELLGYHFWVKDREDRPPRILGMPEPNRTDSRYYEVLNDLAHELADELRRLKATAGSGRDETRPDVEEAQPPDFGATVFLAEVTDDLDPLRDEVKRYLDQAGVHVLPGALYSRHPIAFQQAVDDDLAKSELFVQLLSAVPGKKSLDLPQGYAFLQYERASQAAKPIIQWRNPELELTDITDTDHRAFLELETVLAVSIEEFKREIVQRALSKSSSSSPRPRHALVFVDAEEEDRSMAESLSAMLTEHGLACALPMRSSNPAEVRKDLEENLMDCDALIVVYGNVTVLWVREQLRYWYKMDYKRDYPLKVLTVYEGPPEPKAPLDFMLPNLYIVNCRAGLDESQLRTLLGILRAE